VERAKLLNVGSKADARSAVATTNSYEKFQPKTADNALLGGKIDREAE
jgi:hypothetical protein